MAKHKYTTALCIAVVVIMLAITLLFIFGESLGITVAHTDPLYVSSLFSTDKVHTLDIVVDEKDWEEMLSNARAKDYIAANVVIDGESVKNVGIRPKGNSSLSSIAMSDSDRYSFKIEFDHYNGAQTYQGLDKLALNNIAQDNTYLKDYVSYQMMDAFGATAPLCSFIYITVNGEEWGLYLAVEGVEEAFASRNYGSDYGQLYKPDNMDMNAGREGNANDDRVPQVPGRGGNANGERFPQMPDEGGIPNIEGDPPVQDGEMPEGLEEGGFPQFPQEGEMPNFPTQGEAEGGTPAEDEGTAPSRGGFGGFGGRSTSDVALIYTDDEYESYQNIFDNAKFNPTNADKDRLIASIKQLNEGVNLEEVVNIDEVLRYFVVHNFVLNFDSYTGSMLHNYYLYEEDGVLSMIAWDYNLAFSAFRMGGNIGGSAADAATTAVNYPIGTPVSGASMEDRPLLNQLLSDETYLELYHSLFGEFTAEYFDSGAFEEMYDNTVALISPYVEKDPTAFCTYDEFMQAQEALRAFCLLRADSVRGQLNGTISSTSEGQAATENEGFVDASHIDINAMGSNMMGFNRARDMTSRQTRNNMGVINPESENDAANGFTPSDGFDGQQENDNEAPLNGESFPFGGNNRQNADGGSRMPGWNMATESSASNNQQYWFLSGALILMLGGLLFALKYKNW